MKLISTVFLFAFIFAQNSFAAVYELKNIDDVFQYANANTLVVFDLDNTLIRPVNTLGSEQWFDYLVKNYIDQGETPQHAVELGLQMWFPLQSVIEMAPVETNTNMTLGVLAYSGVTTLALTSRSREVSDATFQQLLKVGTVFSFEPATEQNIPAPKPAFYRNGVIFSGDNNKGDVLKAFLEQNNLTGKTVVFVDNKQKHVDNLEHVFNGQKYVGLRYSFSDQWIGALDACAVDYQWEQYSNSGVLLSDREAAQHCQH